jgi:hypothetical protein
VPERAGAWRALGVRRRALGRRRGGSTPRCAALADAGVEVTVLGASPPRTSSTRSNARIVLTDQAQLS